MESHDPADEPPERDIAPFVEIDPTGRYGRLTDVLGKGSVKKVYRAFDMQEGIEVAWNQVHLKTFQDGEGMIRRLRLEINLLRTLSNENIIMGYDHWVDKKYGILNFITEVCSSGNLRDYRRKHQHVSMKAVKKWCRQILRGLEYLHSHDPCIIHRDLNCSNIFINGNTGKVKLGDFGLAGMVVGESHRAHSMIGTPEFMAPELYDENYTEKVDIYAFGMCVLELVSLEIPYSECDSVVKIYKKVSSGMKPKAIDKVKDDQVKKFIEKCLAEQSERPSASELLKDPFSQDLDDNKGNQLVNCFRNIHI